MKLIKNLPKKLFQYKKSPSITRSDNPSFGSVSTSSSSGGSSSGFTGSSTPITVLPEIPAANSAEIYAELLHAFHLMDSDHDGKIKKEELESILSRVGSEPTSQEEVELLLNEVNVDEDGCISLEEFEVITSAFGTPACDEELKGTFDFFDVNHDGKITAEGLFNVFRRMGDGRYTLEDCRRMIRGVDKKGDGFVCFQDFCVMMEQQRG